MDSDQCSSSVVEAEGVLYGIEGRANGSVAVRAGGKGDVSESDAVWSGKDTGRSGSPLVADGRIYTSWNGFANCIRAEDSSSVLQGRLPSAGDSRESDRENPGNTGLPRFGGGARGCGVSGKWIMPPP